MFKSDRVRLSTLITNADVDPNAAIAYSKLNLTNGIVNADINASAAIAYSKLNLATSIVNADIAVGAAIAYSKLNLTGSILNADINASAAIAYSKLNLTGSIVNADISASAAIAYSKLNLATSIVNTDVSASAAIAYSKLNLSASIVNADISSSASIARSKISRPTVNPRTSNYTATTGDNYIFCDTSSGGFTVSLFTTGSGSGFELTIVKLSGDNNVVTIDGNGSQTIDGELTQTLGRQFEAITIVSNSTTNTWQIVNRFFFSPIVTKSSAYTVIPWDETILCDTGSAWTLTLLPSAGMAGKELIIKKTTSDTNALTISPAGVETIDGASSYVITRQYESVTLVSNGSNWFVKSSFTPGRVISNASAKQRIEWAHITGASANISAQSSSAVSGVTRSSAGLYTINFTSGYFSAAPVIAIFVENTAAAKFYYSQSAVDTSGFSIRFSNTADSANVDANFCLMILGTA